MCRKLAVIWLVFVVFFVPAAIVGAKCPFIMYSFKGNVALPEEIDLGTVRIVLFLDDLSYVSSYPPAEGKADFVVPGKEGEFEIVAYFSTVSGKRGCRGRARSASLVVLGEGVRAYRKVVDLRTIQKEELETGFGVNLGQISLRKE